MIKLLIRTGTQEGEVLTFPTDQAIIRLGRGLANDMTLHDKQASRYHAQISRHDGGFLIRDLDSTNGTFVNDRRLTGPRLLKPGDQIRIGDVVIECEMEAEAAAAGDAAGGVGRDWEASLWEDEEVAAYRGRRRLMVWGVVGIVAMLALATVAAVMLALRSPGEPTPVAGAGASATLDVTATAAVETVGAEQTIAVSTASFGTAAAETAAVEAARAKGTATAAGETMPTLQPSATDTRLPPTVDLLPTRTATALPAPTLTPPPTRPPTAIPPTAGPGAAGPGSALEALPAAVTALFPGVTANTLPAILAAQLDTLTPGQVQSLVAALFPGVDAQALPEVVAASFPQMQAQDLERMLETAFPGQTVPLPAAGSIGGRLALGIYDSGRRQYDLYLADPAAGRTQHLLAQAGDPDLSPDGQFLVYHSWIADKVGLRVRGVDGSGDRLLTSGDQDGCPSFSPDGQRIVYFNAKTASLHVVNRDGTGQRDVGQGEYPSWSPVGNRLVYRGCVGRGECGLIVAGADGSNPRQITTHPDDMAPRWSPNGGQIAFMSDRDGNWEIYVVNGDGSWLRRITMDPASDIMPTWSPDGLRLAWRSDREGKGGVWVTSGIGGAASRLFEAEFGPEWTWARLAWAQE